jgi:hypothetical protein
LTRHSKTQQEEHYAKSLLEFLQIETQLISIPEPLDTVFNYNGQVVGIEVSTLIRTEENQHIQEIKEHQTVSCEKHFFEAHSEVPLWVSVQFCDRVDDKNQATVAQWIAALLIANLPPDESIFTWNASDDDYGSYPPCVAFINSAKLSSMPCWTASVSSYLNAGLQDVLQNTIAKKQEKLGNYLTKCDECWLLLVANWLHATSFFEWPFSNDVQTPQNGFARIYFYNRIDHEFTQIK